MKKTYIFFCAIVLTLLSIFDHVSAQTQTVGLFSHLSGTEDDGYVLFSPLDGNDTTYLIDMCGRLVHEWGSDYTPGADVYLLPDGTLLRSGNYPNPVFTPSTVSAGGVIQRFNWDGSLLWQYVICNAQETQNHDVCYLPNGHILAAVWEVISDSEAIANGRNPSTLPTATGYNLWSAKVVELEPVGTDSANIVWQWRVWDHLVQDFDPTKPNYGVVADHPELLNVNATNYAYDPTPASFANCDWLHFNAVTYNPALDQIMVSTHNLSEIWVIDHSTDSTQAKLHAGGAHNKGGDFLYRWGNPAIYNRGTAVNQKFFQQHDPTWITTGKYANQIMVYNNGLGRPSGPASSIDIINPPIDSLGNYSIDSGAAFGPDTVSWTYMNTIPDDFYSPYLGSGQTLPNGNILICEGMKGNFFEIDSDKTTLWDYVNPISDGVRLEQGVPAPYPLNSSYRCTFYQASYSGFAGDTLPSGLMPLELDPLPYTCEVMPTESTKTMKGVGNFLNIYPNPATDAINVSAENINNLTLYDITGRMMLNEGYNDAKTASLDISSFADGVYILCVNGSAYNQIAIRH